MKRAVLVTALLGLAACTGQQTRPQQPAHVCDAGAENETCARLIAALPEPADGAWQMTGRVAVVTGNQSGNARIEWQQQGAQDYQVTLSAPLTRQSWRLDVGHGIAVIHGLPEGSRQGADAEALLQEVTGWQIPLAALPHWLHGRAAPGAAPAQYRFSADGALLGLVQNGWRIDFTHGAQGLARISASLGENRVRLVIDQWSDRP